MWERNQAFSLHSARLDIVTARLTGLSLKINHGLCLGQCARLAPTRRVNKIRSARQSIRRRRTTIVDGRGHTHKNQVCRPQSPTCARARLQIRRVCAASGAKQSAALHTDKYLYGSAAALWHADNRCGHVSPIPKSMRHPMEIRRNPISAHIEGDEQSTQYWAWNASSNEGSGNKPNAPETKLRWVGGLYAERM